eukprot:gene1215-1922_t
MRALTRKQAVKEEYVEKHYSWYLTTVGVVYIREVLHLPPDVPHGRVKRTAAERALAQRSEREAGMAAMGRELSLLKQQLDHGHLSNEQYAAAAEDAIGGACSPSAAVFGGGRATHRQRALHTPCRHHYSLLHKRGYSLALRALWHRAQPCLASALLARIR